MGYQLWNDKSFPSREATAVNLVIIFILQSYTVAYPVKNNSDLLDAGNPNRPDHLNAVPLERDGHLNLQFRKEIILGHQGLSEEQLKDPDKLLKDIFHKVDKDSDGYITRQELTAWITEKTEEHLDQAIRENVHIFLALDKNHNGVVSWDEYHARFLKEHGFDENFIKNHPEHHKGLSRHVREEILLDQKAWSGAARSDPDSLNIDEFLSFRHPEQSMSTLFTVVQELFERMDGDSDQILTIEEFSAVPPEGIPTDFKQSEESWLDNRANEFKQVIDADHDGRVTKQELLMYANPRNPAHAGREAHRLILSGDTDRDIQLSLEEILQNKELFLGSKMVDTAKSFHDEF